jgi:hypothetical protein
MRRIILIAVVCAFVAAPVLADTVTFKNGYGIWQTELGGEFTLDPSTGLEWVLSYYAPAAKDQGTNGTFQTFCLEAFEHVYSNATYTAVLNDKAINGGVGAAGDPLSVGAAWLYYEFAKGTLTGYDYSDTGVGREPSADALQKAIWALEEESGGSINTTYNTMLVGKFGTIANAKLDNMGQYGVKVLNLYEGTTLRQDVLVLVPVPGAMLLGFLGLGYAGMRLRKVA